MRQHKAVLQFFVRSSFYKLLVVMMAMILAEGVQFYRTAHKMLQLREQDGELTVMTPELVFDEAHLMVFFGVAVIALTVLLACVGRNGAGHQEYTLYRLSISPKSIFLWQTVCNVGCFFLLWFVQVIFAFGLCQYYSKTADTAAVTHQSLLLAFYRSSFLYGLLPLQNLWCFVRNVLLFMSLGSVLAYEVYCSRRGKNRMWTWWLILFFGLSEFQVDLNEYSYTYGAEAAVYAGVLLWLACITLVGGVWNLDEAANKK